MYEIEYMWTKELIINTGINIDTVKLSNWKLQNILNDSLSNHLNKLIETGLLFNPTSKKLIIANIVVVITLKQPKTRLPVTPTFLPKNPDTIDPNKGKIIILKYIIYNQLQYFLLVYKKLLK